MITITKLPLNTPVTTTFAMNIETFFFGLLVLTGLCALTHRIILARTSKKGGIAKVPPIISSCAELFGVVLLAWIIRAFIAQGYYVPTGSLEPTVIPGDVLFVHQYSYGLHMPLFHNKIYDTGTPKRGDIALFYWPKDTSWIYIKRVIGLPGDHIIYKNKTLTINGMLIKKSTIGPALTIEPNIPNQPVIKQKEWLNKIPHLIYTKPYQKEINSYDIHVPKGHYFMMGDNRDESSDSRFWGFVPEANLIGQAKKIIFSINWKKHHIRHHRFIISL
jgi:signal peptidase I